MISRLMLFGLFTTACVEDVGKDKAKAEVIETTEEAKATPQLGEATNPANSDDKSAEPGDKATSQEADATSVTVLKVNQAKSSIDALSAKVSATHPIQFPSFSGEVHVTKNELTKVSFTIDMATLKSDNERLTKHLLNEDFFDVPKYPNSTFVSNSIVAKAGDAGTTHEITGDLTIIGNTKTIKFPATVTVNDTTVTANTEFSINRQDFGVNYKGRADDLIQDNVVLTIALTADR